MRRSLFALAVPVLAVLGLTVAAPAASADAVDPTGVTASVQDLNVGVSWHDGDTTAVTGYVVSTTPPSPTVTVPAGATSAVLTGVRPGIDYTVSVAAQTSAGAGSAVAAPGTVRTTAPGGSFVALPPARLLDTRAGIGAPKGATNLVALSVTGRDGVPATGVSAVALNVTVTGTSGSGYVTAYPAGGARPVASNLNYTKGYTGANLVVVPVGDGGVVDLYASVRTQLLADIAGYYTTTATASPSTGLFHALAPVRLLDTRSNIGGATPGPGGTVNLTVTGVGGVPATGVSAVVLNTTVTAPTGTGYVTVYPAGQTRPVASALNFVPGQTVANRVVVPVGAHGQVSLFNSAGRTPLLADVTGWYTDGSDASAGGAYYVAVAPHRLVDTRSGLGAPKAPLGEAGVLRVPVAGQDGLPSADAAVPPNAAALTVTVADPTVPVYTTVYPSLGQRPVASDLNANPGQDVPNLALAELGTDGAVDVFNSHGRSDYVVDLSGYFIGAVDVPASTTTPAPGVITSVSGDPGSVATVTLAPGTPAPPIGQVITEGVTPATPNGLLVQVTSTSTDGSGDPVVTTQPATLQQAVGDADMDISVPLGAADVASIQQQAAGPHVPTGHTGTIGAAQLRARSLNPAAEAPISGNSHQLCSGDNTSGITITDQFNPTLVFDAHLGHQGLTPTVSAKAGIDISEQAGASITFGGTVTCSWSTQLARYTFEPVTFDVAGVPVVIVPVFTLTLQASASGQAQLSASVSQNFNAQAGIQDDNGAVSPYHSITNSIGHTGPGLTAADATASVALVGDLEGKLYGITGPDVSLTATLTANVDPSKSPWWTLGFTLTGHAEIHFTVLTVQVDVQVNISLLALTLAQASGGSTGSPPVITTTSLPTAEVGFPYSTALTTADHRTGTWSVSSGALPSGLFLSGFTISGQADTGGTSAFTLKFTDTTGHTVTAKATLTVDGRPGTITGRVTDPHGDPLNGVSVSAYGNQHNYGFSTDATGAYTATVAPGQYTICFDGQYATGGTSDATGYVYDCYGWNYPSSTNPTTLSVHPAATVSGINVALAIGGAVSGRLTGPTGAPEGDVRILAEAGADGSGISSGFVYSNDDGSYVVPGLAQGSYVLCFIPETPATTQNLGAADLCYQNAPLSVTQGTKNTVVPVNAVSGKTVTGVNVKFGAAGAISGRVTDAQGHPLAGVDVSASGAAAANGTGYDAYEHDAFTDANGDFLIGNLSAGTEYNVCYDGQNATSGSSTTHYDFECYGSTTGSTYVPPVDVTVSVGHITPNINWSLKPSPF